MTRTNYRQIARGDWEFGKATDGTFSYDAIQSSILLCIRDELQTINNQLRSLGSDGVHALIRLGLTEVRAMKKKRLAREKRGNR